MWSYWVTDFIANESVFTMEKFLSNSYKHIHL